MSENKEYQKWKCLNEKCEKVMDKVDMIYVNKNGKCPYCHCTYFTVKIHE